MKRNSLFKNRFVHYGLCFTGLLLFSRPQPTWAISVVPIPHPPVPVGPVGPLKSVAALDIAYFGFSSINRISEGTAGGLAVTGKIGRVSFVQNGTVVANANLASLINNQNVKILLTDSVSQVSGPGSARWQFPQAHLKSCRSTALLAQTNPNKYRFSISVGFQEGGSSGIPPIPVLVPPSFDAVSVAQSQPLPSSAQWFMTPDGDGSKVLTLVVDSGLGQSGATLQNWVGCALQNAQTN